MLCRGYSLPRLIVLFDRRLAGIRADSFDIGGYTKGFDLCQSKGLVIEELVYRVRHARVAVTDAVDEAADASPWERAIAGHWR